MDKEEVVYKVGEKEMKVVREAAAAGYKAERRFTYEDYKTWPDDERWELIDGIPFRMDAPTEYHQQISGNLFFAIRGYLTGKHCKAYHAPFDVRLHIDGTKDTVVQPDILVICDRSIIDRKGAKGSPDLIIEILSPSTAKKDQTLKLTKYEKYKVKEFWMIDPLRKIVSVYVLNEFGRYNEPVIYQSITDIIEAAVLSNFKISLEYIFTWENVANNELFESGMEQGVEREREEGIKRIIDIMRDLVINEDLIAQKLKEKFQLKDDEVLGYLKR